MAYFKGTVDLAPELWVNRIELIAQGYPGCLQEAFGHKVQAVTRNNLPDDELLSALAGEGLGKVAQGDLLAQPFALLSMCQLLELPRPNAVQQPVEEVF